MCDTHNNKKTKKDLHDQEHKKWNRRSFLQALGLVGGGTIMVGGMPISASRPSPLVKALSVAETDRVLVLIRLKGGNDGINTIVPVYDYDIYANLRPTIKHDLSDLYNLNPNFAIPNYMNEMQSLWGDGAMKVVHGVGYENQDLSHFTGSNIWASTDASDSVQTGWFGRYFEQLYPDYLVNPPEIPAAIQIGSIGNLIFDGDNSNYAFSLANVYQLESLAENGTFHNMENLPDCTYGEQLQFIRGTTNTTYTYAGIIQDAYTGSSNSVEYLDQDLGNQLSIVARMIKGNLGTKVYMVTLGSFDTHANQVVDQQYLLNDLSNSLKLFFDDLAATGHDQDVLAMTISEFGRRVEENGSNGTDHGTASPLMLFGPGLEGNGFVGNHPSLTELNDDGNLVYNVDFREIYATVMQEWLCINPTIVNQALLGQNYNTIDLGFNCQSLSVDDQVLNEGFSHYVLYRDNKAIIKFKNPYTQHTVVKLYDILGKQIATLKNELLIEGEHEIDVREQVNQRLSSGQYIYRISVGDQNFSKSLVLR